VTVSAAGPVNLPFTDFPYPRSTIAKRDREQPMTHQASANPPRAADNVAWLTALLAQCRVHGIPGDFVHTLETRLGTVSFVELVGALEAIAASPDRGVAIQLYNAWIRANPDPLQPRFAAWFNLGAELTRAGNPADAMIAYQNALAFKPDFHPAAANLGLQLEAQGQTESALQVWARALQSNEARTTLINHRARLLEQSGRLDEAERELHTSLATDKAQPDAIQHWVHLRQKMCRWPVFAGQSLGLTDSDLLADCGPLAALSLTDRVTAQTEITARWIARKTAPAPERLSPPQGYRHDRIRIGYMSSDFGRHAMGYLIAELFERHDRSRFTVHGYALGHDDGSDIRARIVAAFDRFTPLQGLSDELAARVIAADEIDILVDLNGLTAGARPQILRWRPAPVQATYLGFIGPVPLPELDYLFCDDYVVPAEIASAYQPAPLPIATNYQANDSRRVIGHPTSRQAAGLPDGAFVFCCFSNHYKVTQEMFAAWMAILARVDGAVLWLAADNAWSRDNLKAEAARHGIDPARLIFAERVDPASYIARLSLADLFLDTFPYNAGTIASDAIRMRLPLLTLSGESFASRMAARLLEAAGATPGITNSLAEYVERAAALGADPAQYAAYRALFTEAAWHETIGNITRFTAEFETTLLSLPGRIAS
jgi:predicted O-linked N-acetylglucosamine transferase (SPINDLY family)